AADAIAAHVHDIETSTPDAAILVTGHCTLTSTLPHYDQYVDCQRPRLRSLLRRRASS
ncbi:hypothetical protein BaRGS_00009945, partial [Batillaria attramentaria]